MKRIIDISDGTFNILKNMIEANCVDPYSLADIIVNKSIPYEEVPNQNNFASNPTEVVKVGEPLPNSDEINKALEKEGYKQAIIDGKTNFSRPKEEREFIEIFAEDIPDDIYTNPEYRGKPYYSIHYTQNGEDFVGFGTYSPKVLSRYLREYFFEQKGSEENEV